MGQWLLARPPQGWEWVGWAHTRLLTGGQTPVTGVCARESTVGGRGGWLGKRVHRRDWLWAARASSSLRSQRACCWGSAGKPCCHPPSFFIPARKHFLSLQYRHWFLLSLSTTHCLLNLGRRRGVRSSKTAGGRTRQSTKLQGTLGARPQRVPRRKKPQFVPFPHLL